MHTNGIPQRSGQRLKTLGLSLGLNLGLALGLGTGLPAQAAVDIASVPLFLTASVDPNLMFILDDSGSMQFELMPDGLIYQNARYIFPRASGIYGGNDYGNRVPTVDDGESYNARARSPQVNTLYYNPSVTYTPWSRYDGSLYPAASPTCALHNPERPGTTTAYCRDLTVDNGNYNGNYWCPSSGGCNDDAKTYWPATYFWHNGGSQWTWGNYTKVEIESTTTSYTGHGREDRTDCAAAPTCTYTEEMQNFANWYSYYRSRVLAARAGIGKAFAEQGEGMRVGFAAINKGSTSVDGVSTRTVIDGVRPFTGSDRINFFDRLYGHTIPNSGTPLRRALDAVGQYFSRTDNRGPWGAMPGTDNASAHLQCRQNFSILMTDGYWSGGDVGGGAGANNDGTGGPTHTGPNDQSYTYEAVSPFTDGYSNTLADVAMYYWKNDLRTDLANEVPTSAANPAFWQHMVTFGVGLGVNGAQDPDAAFAAIGSDTTTIDWNNPTSSNAAKLDDLLHAAVNSRGGFFSAADPVTFANELGAVLSTIVARVESSSTSAAASSATLQTDTLLYTAGFRSSDWSGQLQARHVNLNGSLGGVAWSAETKLREQSPAGRTLVTVNSDTGSGVALALGNLGAAQQVALDRDSDGHTDGLGSNRIAWLHGDETAHASFRSRSESGEARLLGDIINSNPQFAGKKNFGYRLLSGGLGESYMSFRNSASYKGRPDMLYLGANDGMLHAFDATTGSERFAYIPSELLLPEISTSFARINRLMTPDYSHRFFVDGTVAVGDAHWGGSWRTALVGSMGAGGRSVFALDVTSPQGLGPSNILWEFTDPDLGYGVGQPTIARMSNGEWAAVFGNGYNSDSHRAMLFIVRLSDGELLAKIDTGSGTAGAPNGLAAPTVALSIADLSADTIYAGDLNGRLWRFKVSGPSSSWKNSSKVLFQARDAGGTPQPITAAPEVAILPDNPDKLIVTFGTGSYFRTQDDSSQQIQTLYGIIDDNGTTVTGRGQLQQQSITWQGEHTTANGDGYTLREVSDTPMTAGKGWYLDLSYGGNAVGERVVSRPALLSGATRDRVRFSTLIPDKDPCGARDGRTGFVMDIMLASGGRADHPVFDLNSDGLFDDDDKPGERNVSGLQIGGGEEMIVISDEDGLGHMYVGDNHTIVEEPGLPRGRQSWRQIR